jgi:hypothetical protein
MLAMGESGRLRAMSKDSPALQHPLALFESLRERIQRDGITRFREIDEDWLNLIWCLDQYRIRGLVPAGMGNPKVAPTRRFAAIYRMKGNWFGQLLAALLQNRTRLEVASRTRVQGFSQWHQIDVAWPPREVDPLICIETKVTGAPAYLDTPARGALSDWTNRRKELKFASTDLKLFRSQDATVIDHWGVWRGSATPRTYFVWAARMRSGRSGDRIETLVREAQALVSSYLEGAAIVAWAESADGMYEYVPLPPSARGATVDDVLHRVATEIKGFAPAGEEPEPVLPGAITLDIDSLEADSPGD